MPQDEGRGSSPGRQGSSPGRRRGDMSPGEQRRDGAGGRGADWDRRRDDWDRGRDDRGEQRRMGRREREDERERAALAGGRERDAPAGGRERDASAGGRERDAPAGGRERDAPAGGRERDASAGGRERDAPAGGRERDAPAGGREKWPGERMEGEDVGRERDWERNKMVSVGGEGCMEGCGGGGVLLRCVDLSPVDSEGCLYFTSAFQH